MRKELQSELIDDLMSAGTSQERVWAAIRRDRQRRRTTRVLSCIGAACLALAAIIISSHEQLFHSQRTRKQLAMQSATVTTMPVETKPKSADSETQRLDEVMEGTPFAVMRWPNGEETILVVSADRGTETNAR